MATLATITEKVRFLTRSLSTNQLSDAKIYDYINTFLIYDFPLMNELIDLRKKLTFYTKPYVQKYSTTTLQTDPMYDFKAKYVQIMPPVYLAGRPVAFYQNEADFYRDFNQIRTFDTLAAIGDGITTDFVGTLQSFPVLQSTIVFTSQVTSVSGDIEPVTLHDVPDDTNGSLMTIGTMQIPNAPAANGTINYVTGDYSIQFDDPPDMNASIYAEYVAYKPGLPIGLLYTESSFIMTPVPDRAYEANIFVRRLPTELLTVGDVPELDQWWQCIAYGAAIKVFQDRMDADGEAQIRPEFENQLTLCDRRTHLNLATQSAKTIFKSRGPYPQFYNDTLNW